MKPSTTSSAHVRHRPAGFLYDVLEGLAASPKRLPCKYFYDKRGSELFDRICQLDEYYLTRADLQIMERYAPEMGAQIGPGVMLVEFGSGSSVKTRYLLDALPQPAAYVPVDISREHLHQTAAELAGDYPGLEILPVAADFTGDFALPLSTRTPTRTAVYFPGSTIGNFMPSQAVELLGKITRLCGAGGGLLLGIDLKKDARTIEAAYNDRAGRDGPVQSQPAAAHQPRAWRRLRSAAIRASGGLQPGGGARGDVPGKPSRSR